MPDTQDYSKLSLADLIEEEKKIKRNEIVSAVIIGLLAGVMVYGVVNNGFGLLYILIPLVLIAGVGRNSQTLRKKLQQVRLEISTRKGV